MEGQTDSPILNGDDPRGQSSQLPIQHCEVQSYGAQVRHDIIS